MLGKEIPELMKMLVKEKREEGLELKGMSNRELPKDSYVSFKDDDGYVSFMFIFMFGFVAFFVASVIGVNIEFRGHMIIFEFRYQIHSVKTLVGEPWKESEKKNGSSPKIRKGVLIFIFLLF